MPDITLRELIEEFDLPFRLCLRCSPRRFSYQANCRDILQLRQDLDAQTHAEMYPYRGCRLANQHILQAMCVTLCRVLRYLHNLASWISDVCSFLDQALYAHCHSLAVCARKSKCFWHAVTNKQGKSSYSFVSVGRCEVMVQNSRLAYKYARI